MIYDELWPNGPRLLRGDGVLTLGTDAVMLAAFVRVGTAKRSLDIGCGSGIVSLILAWENSVLSADAFDIMPHAAELARQNAEINGLSERFRTFCADLRDHRSMPGAGAYDIVVSNPPYFPVGSGKSADGEYMAIAREERTCTLKDICQAAAYFTRWGGKFALVHRPERLSEAFCRLSEAGLEPKRLRLIQKNAVAAPSLVLIESRRGGNAGLIIEPPLMLTDEGGGDSDEIKRIYHRS